MYLVFCCLPIFLDPPSAISTEPLLVDSGPTHISLSWGKPPSNNSAPVIAYRVDTWAAGHDGGAIWKELGLTPINSFDAFNLKPNVQYHFRVTPKNRYGWGPAVQTSSPLQVGGVECLPEFTKILPGQVKALLHGLFTLECVVHGSPRPEVIWYKDGLRLGLHTDVDRVKTRKLGSSCCLIIKNVYESDGGRYTCEATNIKGRVATFARLQVVTDPKLYEADHQLKDIVHNSNNIGSAGDTLPIFTMRLRDRRVQVTYPVRLTCQVMGYPKPEISWFKDDRPLASTRHCLITADYQFYTLELASTSLSDSGIYTCTAKNELGSVSCHCSLVVDKGIRAYISPEFCMHLDPVYIFQEGQEIRLTAKVEAYPAVGVAWHRNGVKLRPSRRLRVSLECSGFVELTITDATVCDGGIYSCLASNAVGKAESLCRVCIEPKETDDMTKQQQSNVPVIRTSDMPYSEEPLFVVKPRSSEAYEGDTVIICCEVVGDPKPEVVWLRDFLKPEYYKDAPHFRRIGEGPEYRLEIPYAKLDFTGTYSIIATNCRGEAKAIISLQIYAKDILKQNSMEKGSIRHGNVETLPRFIRQLRPLRCCDGDAVTLEAHVEGLPEPVIIWEKDGRVIPSGKDFDITYDGIKATLSIPRVYPEDEGEYTCVAKNIIGRSLSSACIIVDVPEEKENMLQSQLSRPSGLLSATSTPLSTPRSTPNRSFSPQRRFSHRHSSSEFTDTRNEGQILAAPKFLAIPNNRVVEEGESVRFQCAIDGHPQPWSTWDKDGMIVTPTARVTIKEVDDLRFLEVDEVGYDDAGLYRVTLENDYGRIEATARLDVITRSRYSRSSSSRSVRASSSRRNAYLHRRLMGPSTAIGGRMALAAGFRGFSVPSCKFYHNGVELQENETTLTVFNDQEAKLIIDNVNEDMEGIYTCLIQGQQHEPIATSTVVHFNRTTSSRIEIPEIIKPLPEMIKCKEGDTIDLSFQMNCQLPYTYIWTRINKTWHGETISESQDFNYIDHGNGVLCLRIYDALDIDSGIYTCDIITSEGYKCSTCTALHIETVNTISSPNDLMVLKSPLPVLARIDDNVTFCARVYPATATVTWFVGGHRIEDDGADEFTDVVNSLHLQEGTVVTTSANQKTHSPTLVETQLTTTTSSSNNSKGEIIRQPAYVLEGPNDCTALIGGCVRLSVIFEGVPKPQITWFKASRPIVETSNIIINTSARKSVLQISDIAADDSGKYIVQVMNEYGSDVAVASVAVEGPPEPPSGKPSISQGPDRVAIAWCGPPFDGGCMITGFIIEMQELNDVNKENERNWLEIASVVDSLAYTVKNLKPGCTYRFRVRAENVHGRSEPSMASEPVQIFEKREERNEELQNPIYIKSGGEFKERFDIIEELGKGRFGIVYKVQEKEEPRRILAAKVIKCIKSRDRVKIQEEISIMKSLKHPKLLQLAASFESNREIVMVMEYITGGELFERVVADDFTLTERDCILFVRQVCEGVAYMHSQSIVHLDLKPENIMCKTRTCHQIKIIDFGLAQRLNASTPIRVLFGTPEFIPPEIISYEPIGFQTDMWSVGVICYVLLSGLSPFMGDSDVETFANITRADYDFDDEAFDCVSQQAKDFISNLLVHRKEDRWSAEECLESSWLKPGRYDENLATTKICTDKLKKFIIRRKWQKTGNAIRALGRLATLSASRRNSAASNSGSLPCSPRPSISGISLFNPNISVQMSSLHEEEDNFSIELPPHEVLKRPVTSGASFKIYKARDKSQCSERSDSGYSECSNCSAAGSIQCHCSFKEYETKDFVDHPPKDVNLLTHDLLKKKLEEIAHQSEAQRERCPEAVKELEKNRIFVKSAAENIVKDAQNTIKHDFVKRELSPTGANATTTTPIMLSDFTNTVKMRKKSLENNAHKEKPKPAKANIYDTPGKVSMLKSKFSDLIRQEQVSNNATTTPISSNKHSKDCMDFLKLKRQDYIDACHDKTSSSSSTLNSSGQQTQQSISLPNTPLSTRKVRSNNQSSCYTGQHSPVATANVSTFRLSERVREVTDRLAQQQTICTEARRNNNTTSATHHHHQQYQQQRKDQKNSPPITSRKKFIAT
uniref:Myosin light chain kinase, smooth muscle n=1 Tax=Glossina austeni TaxID=7395 RepID=A0A1A9UZC2_GLOAU